jgi:hypothetical protein
MRKNQTLPCFSDRTAPFFRYRRAASYWIKFASAIAPLLVGAVSFCDAGQSVTLAWDRNAEQDIVNYRLYYATQSGRPSQSLGVGNVTTATISDLNDETTYSFAVAAVNRVKLESPPSNEVCYTTPNPAAHVLTVNSGSGNGSYVAGTIVTVSANAPPAASSSTGGWMIGLFSPILGSRRRQPPCHIRMSRLRRLTRICRQGLGGRAFKVVNHFPLPSRQPSLSPYPGTSIPQASKFPSIPYTKRVATTSTCCRMR